METGRGMYHRRHRRGSNAVVKTALIGYCAMLGFFYACDIGAGCLTNPKFWPWYYSLDHWVKGGVFCWLYMWLTNEKYRVSCFLVLLFSLVRAVWLPVCYLTGINPSNTYWTVILFFCLLPVIFFTVFTPEGRLTKFLDKYSP